MALRNTIDCARASGDRLSDHSEGCRQWHQFPCRLTTHDILPSAAHPPGGARSDEIVRHRHGASACVRRRRRLQGAGSEIVERQGYADPAENKDPKWLISTAWPPRDGARILKSLLRNGKDLFRPRQGGLQTIWAAGHKDVTLAESSITWCCDLGGERLGRNRGGWYIKWSDGLGYYDAVNVAKRIPTSCRTIIPRAGLGDYVCPPSGLAILWNNIKGPKKIIWVQGSQHGYVPPEKYEGRDFEIEK